MVQQSVRDMLENMMPNDAVRPAPKKVNQESRERRQAMKLIYKAKWPIVILFAITFVASFAVLL